MKYQMLAGLSLALLSACQAQPPTGALAGSTRLTGGDSTHLVSPPEDRAPGPLPGTPGIQLTVITPDHQKFFWQRHPDFVRDVPSRTARVTELQRTIERTHLKVRAELPLPANASLSLDLYARGKQLAHFEQGAARSDSAAAAELAFDTPKLSDAEREVGLAIVSYDLVATIGGKATHNPFSIRVYDESRPTLIVPRDGECTLYQAPEKAFGCERNMTRTTQEIVLNDGIDQGTQTSAEFSGGVDLPISIVTFSLGGTSSHGSSQDVSHGSEIHFTNCIECASQIWRQQVESLRVGDVYRVRADGSLVSVGATLYRTKQWAYEFVSTGSESQDYDCESPLLRSRMVSGETPSCGSVLGDSGFGG